MNPTRGMLAPTRFLYRLGLKSRRLLPRQRCSAFGPAYANERIERIYVINLDRQPDRWDEMRRELDQVLDCSGKALTERAVRNWVRGPRPARCVPSQRDQFEDDSGSGHARASHEVDGVSALAPVIARTQRGDSRAAKGVRL